MTEETSTVPLGNINANSSYAASFWMLPDGTRYAGYDADVKNIGDKRERILDKMQPQLKAISSTSGGAGTAGYAMIPIYVDPEIVDRTRKHTPLCELIPRVTNRGVTADYNVITAKGGAFTAAEGATLTETDTTYARQSKSIKALYSVGKVTGLALAATPGYTLAGFQPSGGTPLGMFSDQDGGDAVRREIAVKARELKELEENLIINGNSGTDSTQFDGIITIMGTTNKVDKNNTALTLEDLNTAVRYAYDGGGRPNLAVCSSAVYTDILNLLQAKIGYLSPQAQVFWGMSAVVYHSMVGPINIIPSMFMSNTAGSKAIYFLDLSVWEMRVLQDMTFQWFGKVDDSDKFMLKMYECLICRAPSYNAYVGEIA